jgi:hypothetical protein
MLTFNHTLGDHGQYCHNKHEINLDLVTETRHDPFTVEEFWTIVLAHEYAHAYSMQSAKDLLAYREEGPAYLRYERDMDNLMRVILLALADEVGFPSRDRIRFLLKVWDQSRSQYFLEVSMRWSAKMREEYPPLPEQLRTC